VATKRQPPAKRTGPAERRSDPAHTPSSPHEREREYVDIFHNNPMPMWIFDGETLRFLEVNEAAIAHYGYSRDEFLSMSIRQILKANRIICFVPDARKANAVHACFDGDISPQAPASILRTHQHTSVYVDKESSALLSEATLASAS